MRLALLAAAALASAGAAAGDGRRVIAVFGDWGAFRAEGPPARCWAVAQPPPGTRAASAGAFASVASWPVRRVRAQLSVRLSRAAKADAPVTLSIGDSAFALAARGDNAWAQGRREDAAIVAAMRAGSSMSVSGVAADGTPFADGYRLRGAASAIDAAMLACPPG